MIDVRYAPDGDLIRQRVEVARCANRRNRLPHI